MNPRYKEFFEESTIKEEKKEERERILIVDSLNTFIRSFAVIQHLNKNASPIGGLTGFLRSLGYMIRVIRPHRCILVFDGQGGSTNKRYLYPEYKANRGVARITNWDHFDDQEQESESITNQIVRLIYYLKCLPVDILSIDKIEADDVIGYISQNVTQDVIIASTDRDYLQLVNDRISVYSPIKKKFYHKEDILKEYFVTPQNFLNQKVLLGDSGDNVPGIKGLGIKTLAKHFPELAEEKKYDLNYIIDKAKSTKGLIFEKISNFDYQLKINEKLMDLTNPNIPDPDIEIIQQVLNNPKKDLKTKEFIYLYNEDELGDSIKNVQVWLYDNFYQMSKK